MKRRRRRSNLVAAVVGAIVLTMSILTACNVFVSLDRCKVDGDCPEAYTCNQEILFCVRNQTDASDATNDGADATDSMTNGDSSDGADGANGDATDNDANDGGVLDADADAPVDADADAPPPCDIDASFGSITTVKGLENLEIGSARPTPDETAIIFSGYNGCQQESCIDLFVAQRSSPTAPFVIGGLLPGVSSSVASEYWPTLTSSQTLLFLESGRSTEKVDGGYVNEGAHIWTSTRNNDPLAQFGEPFIQDIFKVDGGSEGAPYLHPVGKSLYFTSNARPGKGGLDIFVATLGAFGSASAITNVDVINSSVDESMAMISFDDRSLYFARAIVSGHMIMVAKRSSPTGPWGAPSPVTELNVSDEWPSWVSDDQCRIYFVSNRSAPAVDDAGPGKYRLWVAERPKMQ